MARYFIKASSQKLEATSAAISGYPFTMAVWVNTTTMAATQTAISVGNSATAANYFALGTLSTAKAFFESANTTTNDVLGGSVLTNGSWNHLVIVALSTASLTIYVNGLSDGTSATGLTPTGLNTTTNGALRSGASNSSFFDGATALPAIWNTNLNLGEVRALYAGKWPGSIRPQSLTSFLDDRLGMPIDNQQKAVFTVTGASLMPNNILGNRYNPPYSALLGKRPLRAALLAASTAANNPAFYMMRPVQAPNNMKALITDY